MKILFLFTGTTKEQYVASALQMYESRLKHYANIEIICTANLKGVTKPEDQKAMETNQLLKHLDSQDFVVLLDEKGKTPNSKEFADFIIQKQVNSCKRMVFIICGAFGAHQQIKDLAHYTLALSKFTFSHQLARIVLAEQVYRAYSIIHNHPYHNE